MTSHPARALAWLSRTAAGAILLTAIALWMIPARARFVDDADCDSRAACAARDMLSRDWGRRLYDIGGRLARWGMLSIY